MIQIDGGKKKKKNYLIQYRTPSKIEIRRNDTMIDTLRSVVVHTSRRNSSKYKIGYVTSWDFRFDKITSSWYDDEIPHNFVELSERADLDHKDSRDEQDERIVDQK